MQPHHYIALSFLCAIGWGLLVLCRRRDPDDHASGTLIGQVSSEEDSFHHGGGPPTADHGPLTATTLLLRRCGWCRSMQGEEPVLVMPGTTVEFTDGICPACRAKHFPLDELAEWAGQNTMVKVPEHLSPPLGR